MPKGVYVYEKDCTDFTTTGIAGCVTPLEGVFTEEKNGISEIVIKLSYDEYNRWKAFKPGNCIKCEVPVRVPPVIENDEYAGTVNVYNS